MLKMIYRVWALKEREYCMNAEIPFIKKTQIFTKNSTKFPL